MKVILPTFHFKHCSRFKPLFMTYMSNICFQEQIRHKDCFNIISFGSKVTPWRDRLVDVSEENLKLAWTWIRNLECDGSTNTLGTQV